MSNKNYKGKISVESLIDQFQTSPKEAYKNLIKSRAHISYAHADKFWTAFRKLNLQSILNTFPDSYEVINKTNKLHLFWDILKLYFKYSKDCEARLVKLNPRHEVLVKALFLSLEIGETHKSNEHFPKYNYDSLEALKNVLKRVTPRLRHEDCSDYSLDLFNEAKLLLRLTIDINLIYEFLDAFEWAEFDLELNETGGYSLFLPSDLSKQSNHYILNFLKTYFKRNYTQVESNQKISDESHFKEIDKVYKTNEGLATVFHNSGLETVSQSPGTTSIKIDDAFFEKVQSADPKESGEAMVKMIHLALTQSFHYHLRLALSKIYQPNDQIDVHSMQIKIANGNYVSLYELFCTVSCLIGMADGFRYVGQIPYTGEIPFVKQNIIGNLKKHYPEKDHEQLANESDRIIANHLPEIEKNNKPFYILSKDSVIRYLRRIEELKFKSDNDLEGIIQFIAELDNGIPFSPIYKIGEEYFFSYRTCFVTDLNRMVYDYFITQKLFSSKNLSKGSDEARLVDQNQKQRTNNFNISIQKVLYNITPFVECGIEFPDKEGKYNFGELTGDIDVLAYFEEENIIIPIQVKLSNTSLHSEKGKSIWIESNIITEGVHQVYKDSKLLSLKNGLEYIGERLKIKDISRLGKTMIFPLIVTDNFYVDHEKFVYTSDGKKALCISYFELKHLILNLNIDSRQGKWKSLKESKSAKYLISLLEENVFWDFLKELAEGVKVNKSLTVINKENRISLIV